jgi:gamma-glutamyltranspeptidase/glutathione hydrolase
MTEKRPATGSRGMVVTNHPLGSAAGAEMIAAGGNAVDVAIGALFALTVVEPMMVGIFDPHPGTPASVAPGKRVTSSMAPTILLRDGRPAWALGLPGGVRIFTSVLQAVVNLIDHGMTLQEAVEAPRIWSQGQELEMEQDIPAAVRDAVAARGHRVVTFPGVAGGMNAVAFAADGTLGGRGVLARRWHAHRGRRRARAARHPLPAGREPPRDVTAGRS